MHCCCCWSLPLLVTCWWCLLCASALLSALTGTSPICLAVVRFVACFACEMGWRWRAVSVVGLAAAGSYCCCLRELLPPPLSPSFVACAAAAAARLALVLLCLCSCCGCSAHDAAAGGVGVLPPVVPCVAALLVLHCRRRRCCCGRALGRFCCLCMIDNMLDVLREVFVCFAVSFSKFPLITITKFVIVRSQNAITNHKIIDHKIL